MNRIGQYLLSVIAAALIVSVSNTLVNKKSAIGSIVKLITGLVLITVIVSPWKNTRLSSVVDYFSATEAFASPIVEEGEQAARSEMLSYIKTHTQAYILDKASTLELDVSVDVTLTENSPPSIQSVTISGNASPYAKQRLGQVICEDLGISEDEIIWY